MVVTQDHSIWAGYGPQKVVLEKDATGTQYALLLVRTFLTPNDNEDAYQHMTDRYSEAFIVEDKDCISEINDTLPKLLGTYIIVKWMEID